MGRWHLLGVCQVHDQIGQGQVGAGEEVVYVLIVGQRRWIFRDKLRPGYELVVVGDLVRFQYRVRTWLAEDHAVIQRLQIAHEISVQDRHRAAPRCIRTESGAISQVSSYSRILELDREEERG